jgi:hypothetical protein
METSRSFLLAASVLALAGSAYGQGQAPAAAPAPAPTPAPAAATPVAATRSGIPQRDTLSKLMRPVSLDVTDKRLEDIVSFVRDFTGADLEPLWIDDRNTEGLDKEKLVTVKVSNVTALTLLEKVLDQARAETGENTWQMSETGSFQMGPKERLNKFRRLEIYDINDLVREIPDYTDVPQIDLQQALQASQQGGGGGQGPFNSANETQNQRTVDRQAKTQEIMDLIRNLVEPDQWTENGGSGGTMRLYQSSLLVNAPDYMHRGIDGYKWWPAANTSTQMVNGRRYVSLTGDTGMSKVKGFGQQPVVGVAGGKIFSSQPGGRP